MSRRRYLTPAIVVAAILATAALAFNALVQVPTPAQAARKAFSGQERLAQGDPKPAPGPSAPGKPERQAIQERRRQAHQDYLNALAGKLGVTPEQLVEAMKQVRIDQVNKLVQEGKLSQEQADRVIQRINSGQAFGPGPIGPGMRRGGPPGPDGMQLGRRPALIGVAQALGVAPREIQQALKSGQSLAEFAQSKGMSRDDLKAKLIETRKSALDAAVARNVMTADQAKQALDNFTANLDAMIDAKPGQRAAAGRR